MLLPNVNSVLSNKLIAVCWLLVTLCAFTIVPCIVASVWIIPCISRVTPFVPIDVTFVNDVTLGNDIIFDWTGFVTISALAIDPIIGFVHVKLLIETESNVVTPTIFVIEPAAPRRIFAAVNVPRTYALPITCNEPSIIEGRLHWLPIIIAWLEGPMIDPFTIILLVNKVLFINNSDPGVPIYDKFDKLVIAFNVFEPNGPNNSYAAATVEPLIVEDKSLTWEL